MQSLFCYKIGNLFHLFVSKYGKNCYKLFNSIRSLNQIAFQCYNCRSDKMFSKYWPCIINHTCFLITHTPKIDYNRKDSLKVLISGILLKNIPRSPHTATQHLNYCDYKHPQKFASTQT